VQTCSSVDSNCQNCENYEGKCTLCVANYAWSEDDNKCIYDCPAINEATNPSNNGCYNCNTIDSNCSECTNFT
jgi:hypothetical protein